MTLRAAITRHRRIVASVLAVATVAAVAAAWVPIRRYLGTLPPAQFYRPVDPAVVRGHDGLFAVAHNAGDNVTTTTRAVRHNAGVVEVDLINARGTIAAGREQPWPWLAEQVFQGPTLAEIWSRTTAADAILLDLKQNDRVLLDELITFLGPRAGTRTVMISTRDADAVLYLHRHLSDIKLLFTLAFPSAVTRLEQDATLRAAIDGVSVYEGLVDVDLVTWLHEQHLLTLAWPVNSASRLGELAAVGVDGVTTDNLAILEMLRGHPVPAH